MDAPEPSVACREVILEWTRLSQLADFAERRHGYGNSNGGFGVDYPEDLDEYDIHVDGVRIPEGSLLLYGYEIAIPPGYEILVDEKVYLCTLREILLERGLVADAERVAVLLADEMNPSSEGKRKRI
ncbi:hypothetical protein J2W27_004352 [Variovorax boronicumulans]|uniref:hypothetical protein n=1 Tax=Variovorax boronicumulans TaxID=436515 RepID=UPI00277FD520|nr:hypothetical protein [Variovorax boronicumulans]MDP9912228.1 hypothetical protein [Variovorax boronicumulans]